MKNLKRYEDIIRINESDNNSLMSLALEEGTTAFKEGDMGSWFLPKGGDGKIYDGVVVKPNNTEQYYVIPAPSSDISLIKKQKGNYKVENVKSSGVTSTMALSIVLY